MNSYSDLTLGPPLHSSTPDPSRPALPEPARSVPPDPASAPPRDLISIFVVTFDPKEGNLLEWRAPKGVTLDGVEFRALISGAHTVTSDFILFREGDYYGLACYEKLEVAGGVERGVWMKSVGVIVSRYLHLHPHLPHLKQLVRYVLQNPGDYKALQDYYDARHTSTPPPGSWNAPQRITTVGTDDKDTSILPTQLPPTPILPTPQYRDGVWRARDNNYDGSVDNESPGQLLHALGEQIATLWRAALLSKRILLLSEPPIGRVCWWVHWVWLLGCHTTPGLPSALLRPLYYVSLADLDTLADQHAYVACTTERIFTEKTGIYDMYVENGRVTVTKKLPALTTITNLDRKRLHILQGIEDLTLADFRSFFQTVNDRIFSVMYRVCGSGGTGVVGYEELVAMGLNPHEDQVFVRELAATHGFDLTVSGEGVCECCCCC